MLQQTFFVLWSLVVLQLTAIQASSDFEKILNDLVKRVNNLEAENQELKKSNSLLEWTAGDLSERMTQLERRNGELESAKATLEERVEYLEAITRKNVPRTCQDLKLLGVTKSGSYMIDPDGSGLGDSPITVECDMESEYGITKVPHNLVDVVTQVEHCPDPGCHTTDVMYEASTRQMKALIDLSLECTQEIQYNCFIAPLNEFGEVNVAWWTGSDGQPNYYWDGSHDPMEHKCACNEDGTCENDTYPCNCDTSAPEWLTDSGTLTNMTALPVTQLSFGGLVYDAQDANFVVGPFTCRGKKEFRATESCETLRMAGHVTSGYYFIDGPQGLHHDLVFCDMDLESTDGDFQEATGGKLPEFQVAFDAFNLVNYQVTDAAVLTWGATYANVGNTFDPATGIFVAPFDGVYKFTAFIDENQNAVHVYVYIRKNGSNVAVIWDETESNEDQGTGSASVILVLNQGDTVDSFMSKDGYVNNDIYTQFMGHLLFPL